MLLDTPPGHPLLNEIEKLFEEEFGRKLFLSHSAKERVGNFIERLQDIHGYTADDILNAYRYLFSWIKDKGYKPSIGILCSPRVLKIIEKAKTGLEDVTLYYHSLYRRKVEFPEPPYDTKLRSHLKFAEQLYSAPRVIYVPRAGLVLEQAYLLLKAVTRETNLWHDSLKFIEKVYAWYKIELGKEYGHRDRNKYWRRKPFWKSLIPKEYFVTPIGPLTFRETELFLMLYEDIRPALTSIQHKFVEARLKPEFDEFNRTYGDYIWLLPEPRTKVKKAIERLCRAR